MNSNRRGLSWALGVYAGLAGVVSVCQRDRINADFVGYVTISHRVLHDFWGSVSGHWSPLFSWLMVPLISAGVPDLVAGRIVLLVAGALYIWAICEIARGFGRVVFVGMLVCTVIQAAVWATYLLDPDLLAAALLFAYCTTLFNPTRGKAVAGGFVAGLAYLAKAYMLPFVLVHLPVSLWLLKRANKSEDPHPGPPPETWGQQYQGRGKKREYLVMWGLYVVGIVAVAAPWVTVLSVHEHRLTFSIAGSSNHANVSPENDKKDPLFNPGLVADYIVEPRLGPDWSPFSSWRNFSHQFWIVERDLRVTLGYVPLWVLLVLGALVWRVIAKNLVHRMKPMERFAVWWGLMTVAVYVGGYAMVIVEARYMVPVCAPLLCLVTLVWLKDFDRAPAAAVIGLVLVASGQQIQRLVQSAVVHYQTRDIRRLEPIAQKLAGLTQMNARVASNRYYDGLVVAYLNDRVKTYLGTPRSSDYSRELEASDASVYLRLINSDELIGAFDDFVPTVWKKVDEVDSIPWRAEIYQRGP